MPATADGRHTVVPGPSPSDGLRPGWWGEHKVLTNYHSHPQFGTLPCQSLENCLLSHPQVAYLLLPRAQVGKLSLAFASSYSQMAEASSHTILGLSIEEKTLDLSDG